MLQQIIDRRLAGKNKSIGNRERFLRRHREQIREAVRQDDLCTRRYHSASSRTCFSV